MCVYKLDICSYVIAEADSMAMMRLLPREDIGIAVLPPIVVKDEIAASTLVEGDALPGIVQIFYEVRVERRFPNPLLKELLGKRRKVPNP